MLWHLTSKPLETKESLAKTVQCYWVCATIYLLYTYAQPSSGRGKKASVFANRQHREAGRREHSRTDNTWTGRARTRRRDEQKGEAEDIIRERRDGAEGGRKGNCNYCRDREVRAGQTRTGQGGPQAVSVWTCAAVSAPLRSHPRHWSHSPTIGDLFFSCYLLIT